MNRVDEIVREEQTGEVTNKRDPKAKNVIGLTKLTKLKGLTSPDTNTSLDVSRTNDEDIDDDLDLYRRRMSENRSTSFSNSNQINLEYAELIGRGLIDSYRNDQSEVDLERIDSSSRCDRLSTSEKPSNTITLLSTNLNLNSSTSTATSNLVGHNRLVPKRHTSSKRHSGKPTTLCGRFFKFMEGILLSPRFNLIVVALVIIDCIFVSLELIIDLTITMQNTHILHNFHDQFKNLTQFIYSNTNESQLFLQLTGLSITPKSSNPTSSVNVNNDNNKLINSNSNQVSPSGQIMTRGHILINKITNMQDNLNNSLAFSIFFYVEEVLRYLSIVILGFFVIEISLKVIFAPQVFTKSKWEIFDAFIVFTSFALDLLFLKNRQLIHTVTGWITLFRLWRITRIINGIIVAIERKSNKKVKKLEKIILHLRRENEDLKRQLAELKQNQAVQAEDKQA